MVNTRRKQANLLLTQQVVLRLANIFDNAGQVFLAVTVLSPIMAGFDTVNMGIVVSGLIISIGLWLTSLILTRITKV